MSILFSTFATDKERYVKPKTPDRWAKRQNYDKRKIRNGKVDAI